MNNKKIRNEKLEINEKSNKANAFTLQKKRYFQVKSLKSYELIFSKEGRIVESSLAPMRLPAKVLQIWIAPFIDTSGNYHSSQMIYTVIEAARWR